MKEIEASPLYSSARLVRMAEEQFLSFVGEPGDDGLSIEVVDILADAISAEELSSYDRRIEIFASTNYDKLRGLYNSHGPMGVEVDEWNYWLMSQPESLIILERIANTPRKLKSVVAGPDIEAGVKNMYDLWGAVYGT